MFSPKKKKIARFLGHQIFFQRCCHKIRPLGFLIQKAPMKNCRVGFLPSISMCVWRGGGGNKKWNDPLEHLAGFPTAVWSDVG